MRLRETMQQQDGRTAAEAAGPFSLVNENDELRPPMMRVGFECYEPLSVQVIDDPLNVLTISAQVASEPRNRLRALGGDDRAQDFPARAG
jgi:hypothetical protein